MDQSGTEHAKDPCYTCRRRRAICDKQLPTCNKCHISGKQCLGYRKPLTWVKGVASRGKMMGLTFDDVIVRRPRKGTHLVIDRVPNRHSKPIAEDPASTCPRFEQALDPRPPSEAEPTERGKRKLKCCDNSPRHEDWARFHCQGDKPVIRGQLYIRPSLVDPVFQGLGAVERYYLSYYDTRLCRLMVLYEIPHQNPYRRLIPFVRTSPALSSAISAVAACHYMHTYRYNTAQLLSERPVFSSCSSNGAFGESANSPNQTIRSIYQDVLMFKQKALHLLNQNLSDPIGRRDEMTIAAIVLLITLDMVETGQGDWKVHIQGAKELIKNQLRTPGSRDELSLSTLHDSFNAFLIGTCMTIDIMGSTLARSGTWSEPFYSQLITSPKLLAQIEQVMFIGCPAYLFRMILFITSIRHSKLPSDQSVGLPGTAASENDLPSILAHIEDFEPGTWASRMQSRIPTIAAFKAPMVPRTFTSSMSSTSDSSVPESIAPRFHLGSAYKIAITVYAIRVLRHPSPRDKSFTAEVTELLTHLSCIPVTSELFKCTLWPIFIAGAECLDPEQRTWITESLQNLWSEYLTVNIRAASSALELIWGRDRVLDLDGTGNFITREQELDWIQFLDRSDFNWLFI